MRIKLNFSSLLGRRRARALAIAFAGCAISATTCINLALSGSAPTAAATFVEGVQREAPKPSRDALAENKAANTDKDDCEIMVILGRELLSWGKTPPDHSQFPIFYIPKGGTFVEQCPWKRLGVTAPAPGVPDYDHMRFFTQPEYSDGGSKARVRFVTKIVDRRPGQSPFGAFINTREFVLVKKGGSWIVSERRQGTIS